MKFIKFYLIKEKYKLLLLSNNYIYILNYSSLKHFLSFRDAVIYIIKVKCDFNKTHVVKAKYKWLIIAS